MNLMCFCFNCNILQRNKDYVAEALRIQLKRWKGVSEQIK